MSEHKKFDHLSDYYKFQSKIYDMTRWTFLYGRNSIFRKIPLDKNAKTQILDIGCGTGKNIIPLAKRFPNAVITGIDLSQDMLDIAAKKTSAFGDRVKLKKAAFGVDDLGTSFDLILCSYMLTMTADLYKGMIEQAHKDLKPDGLMAVVDFHSTSFEFYRKFMYGNHVMLEGQLKPVLEQHFTPSHSKVYKSYALGVWEWMQFVGTKKNDPSH